MVLVTFKDVTEDGKAAEKARQKVSTLMKGSALAENIKFIPTFHPCYRVLHFQL